MKNKINVCGKFNTLYFVLDKLTQQKLDIIETAAEVLYGLIHARFILTTAGMNKMYDKYRQVDFGRCPRSFCKGQPVLPNGLSDKTRSIYPFYSSLVHCSFHIHKHFIDIIHLCNLTVTLS